MWSLTQDQFAIAPGIPGTRKSLHHNKVHRGIQVYMYIAYFMYYLKLNCKFNCKLFIFSFHKGLNFMHLILLRRLRRQMRFKAWTSLKAFVLHKGKWYHFIHLLMLLNLQSAFLSLVSLKCSRVLLSLHFRLFLLAFKSGSLHPTWKCPRSHIRRDI